jgi:hypothetical protein
MGEDFNTPRDVKEIFRNISPGFQNYLVIAQRFSKTQKHFYVGVEHIFAAFLSESKSLIRKILSEEKTNWKKRVQELLVKAYNPQKKQQIWEGYLVTPRVQRLWHEAIQSTRFKDTAEVNEAHVLLQFLEDPECFPFRWLETEAYSIEDLKRKITKEAFPDEAASAAGEEEAAPVDAKKAKKPKEVKDTRDTKEEKKTPVPERPAELQKTISISELFKRDDEMHASMEDTIRLKADFLKEMSAQRKAKTEAKDEFIQIGDSKVSIKYLHEKGVGERVLAKIKDISARLGRFPEMIMFESKEIAFDELLELGLDDNSFCDILEMAEEHFGDSTPQRTRFLEEEEAPPQLVEPFGPATLPPSLQPFEEPFGPPTLPGALQPVPASEHPGVSSRQPYDYQEKDENPYGYKTKELSTNMLREVTDDFLLDNIDVGDVATRLRKDKEVVQPPPRQPAQTPQNLFGHVQEAPSRGASPPPEASRAYDPFGILNDTPEPTKSLPDNLSFGQSAGKSPPQEMGFPYSNTEDSGYRAPRQGEYEVPIGGFLPSQADPFGLGSKERENPAPKSEPVRPFGRIMEPTGSEVEQIKPFTRQRNAMPSQPEAQRYQAIPPQEPFSPPTESAKPIGRPAEGAYPLFEPTKPVGKPPEPAYPPFEQPKPFSGRGPDSPLPRAGAAISSNRPPEHHFPLVDPARPPARGPEPAYPQAGAVRFQEKTPEPFFPTKEPAPPPARPPEPVSAENVLPPMAWDVEPVFGIQESVVSATAEPGPIFPQAEPMRPIEKRPEPPAFKPPAARGNIEVLPEPLVPSERPDSLIFVDESVPVWKMGLQRRITLSEMKGKMLLHEKIFVPPVESAAESPYVEKAIEGRVMPPDAPHSSSGGMESPHKYIAAEARTRELAPQAGAHPQAKAPDAKAPAPKTPVANTPPEKPPASKQPRARPVAAQNVLEDYMPEFPAESGADGIRSDTLEIPPIDFDEGEQDELLAMFPGNSFGEKEKVKAQAQRPGEAQRPPERDEENPVDGLLSNLTIKMISEIYPGELWDPTEADDICRGIVSCKTLASLVSRSPLKSKKILKYLLSELKHRKDPSLMRGAGVFYFDIERLKSISYEKVVASMNKIKSYLEGRKGAILVALEIGFLIQHTGLRKLTEELFYHLLTHGIRCICSMNAREYDSTVASREESKRLYFPFSVKDVTMLQARSFLKSAAPTLEKEMEIAIDPALLEQAAELAYKHLETAVFPEALIIAFRKASHVKKEEFGDMGFEEIESITKKDFLYIVSDSSFL